MEEWPVPPKGGVERGTGNGTLPARSGRDFSVKVGEGGKNWLKRLMIILLAWEGLLYDVEYQIVPVKNRMVYTIQLQGPTRKTLYFHTRSPPNPPPSGDRYTHFSHLK